MTPANVLMHGVAVLVFAGVLFALFVGPPRDCQARERGCRCIKIAGHKGRHGSIDPATRGWFTW